MSQRLRISCSRGGRDERLWLSMLVDAMEEAAEPAAQPCDSQTLAALRAQLALPAQPRFVSSFSFRN